MTIEATTQRRLVGPVLFMIAALTVITCAGVSARAAFASSNGRYLSSSRSLQVLRIAYAGVSERPIREPQVVVAPTSAKTWALSDKVNMANGAWNPRAGRPWAYGDAFQMWPAGMGGFVDPATATVYVNAQTAVESNVPHELLHANSAPEFLAAVGVSLNEGVTEQLALDALAASGVRAETAPAYPKERALAAAMIAVTGRDRLVQAYFNGGSHLAELVTTLGADTLGEAKEAAARNDTDEALHILESAGATRS